jgi:argininosuccinate lyase
MTMKLWGGRFEGKLDPAAWALNSSLPFDQRLAEQDVRGSLAWAEALREAGVLTPAEAAAIRGGLEVVLAEFVAATFAFQPGDEDIHTAVERRLGELIGAAAGKLHTGRSRNDQVATDLRLWLRDHLPRLRQAVAGLQAALVARAEADGEIILPGYTHLQRAQPILLSHWWLSHFWPLVRDCERLGAAYDRAGSLPLGSGALAGVPFPIDRMALAQALDFPTISANSLDAVADRDFVAEFLFAAALLGTHLSRLGEAMVLFTSAEFGFFELADAFSTGSSLMPQKKNPDVFELARGKAGTLLGGLTGLLATLKGLPSTYDKDLQEDKLAVFAAYDTLSAILPVLAGALATLTLRPERMQAALDPAMLATDLADYLVARGVPFRQAHEVTGQAVQRAAAAHKSLAALTLAELHALHPIFAADVAEVFDFRASVARRAAPGGTAPAAVAEQLTLARRALAQA